jgi:hypothetical protein
VAGLLLSHLSDQLSPEKRHEFNRLAAGIPAGPPPGATMKIMKTAILLTLTLLVGAAPAAAAGPEDTVKAFDHYEAIRVALAADTVKGIAEHATALAPIAATVAGADAKKHADLVAKATDLKTARQHFGPLSAALLPAFEKAAMKDVYFYNCSMVQQSWAQRGKAVENPYMGKGMLACGVPVKASK